MPDTDVAWPPHWSSRTLTTLQRKLLRWFDTHRRELPWRIDRDPYRIWLSEVMLQQTTVTAVVPYFERFLAAFPTIESLAAAEEQAVLKLWQGLGYYRRARHLHLAAKQIVANHAGIFPNTPDEVGALPGVGRYIRGAILSQAFDQAEPIVEANSLRVLARWFAFEADPRTGTGLKWVWQAAAAVVPKRRPGDFNQALMELGALVCTPTKPNCPACPLQQECAAKHLDMVERIPPPKQVPVITDVREVAIILRRGESYLLAQRPDNARWASMWEFPHGEVHPGEPLEDAATRITRELLNVNATDLEELHTLTHSVTRYRITLTALTATAPGRAKPTFHTKIAWLTLEEARTHPVSQSQHELIEVLRKPPTQLRLF